MSGRLSPELVEAIAQRGRESLYFLAKGVLGYADMVPQVHLPLCRALESQDTRLLFEMPRGTFKSTLVSIAYPIWSAVRNPNVKQLLVQNTFTNAKAKLATIDRHFKDNALFRTLYRSILPNTQSIWRGESMCVNRESRDPEGTFEAAGANTQVVSRHYDTIIEDDTVAPDLDEMGAESLMPTKDDIEKAIGWHRLMPPLLVHPTKSRNIVVGTRWFETDLISWIKENQKDYHVYSRAIRETAGLPDPDGTPIWPERFDEETLRKIENDMGPYLFSCLYMNQPIRPDDMVFRPEWFRYFETAPRGLVTYTTVDPAGDPEENIGKTDYNVVLTMGKDLKTGLVYLLSYDRFKGNPGELIEKIVEHVKVFKPIKVGVESVGYQQALLYFLRERKRQENIGFLVEPIRSTGKAKNIRITGLQPLLQSGTLLIRPQMQEFVKEALAFPLGKHDDLLDAASMQLPLLRATPTVRERREELRKDPFSLDAAVEELSARAVARTGKDLRPIYSSLMESYALPSGVRAATSAIRSEWARRGRVDSRSDA